jgi:hypothetical protein
MTNCKGKTIKGGLCKNRAHSGGYCMKHQQTSSIEEKIVEKSMVLRTPKTPISYRMLDLNSRSNYNLEWKHILNTLGHDMKSNRIILNTEIKEAKESWIEKGKKSQFEPRLLCKQDFKEERPNIFQQNQLSLLAIENGKYLLTKTNIYFDLKFQNVPVIQVEKNKNCLLLQHGDSESMLIDNIRYAGIFERNEFLGEPIEFGPLMRGRHRCSFDMKLEEEQISVKGVQIETDACYISKNKILLIECKKGNSIGSFNIRQLYYPYRYIKNIYGEQKEVVPIFVYGDKKNIYIWKFKFEDVNDLNSIVQQNFYKYEWM